MDSDWVQVLTEARKVVGKSKQTKPVSSGHTKTSTALFKQLGSKLGQGKVQTIYVNFLGAAIELHGMLDTRRYGDDVARMLMQSKDG